jgi:hypothetical protein
LSQEFGFTLCDVGLEFEAKALTEFQRQGIGQFKGG